MVLAGVQLPQPDSRLARTGPTAIVLVATVGWTAALVLDRFNAPTSQIEVSDAVWGISFLAPVVIGAVLAHRLPTNPVGWLLALGPALVGVSIALFEYVDAAAARDWPAASIAGPPANPTFALGTALLGAALLLFPDGRLPGPRWRGPVRALAMAVAIAAMAGLLVPTVGSPPTVVQNPIGLPLGGVTVAVSDAAEPVATLFYLLALIGGIRRAVRGDGTVRRQFLGLVYPLGVAALFTVGIAVVDVVGTVPNWLVAILVIGVNVSVPSGIAVAVTRYRLYEIDRLVSRTLSYAVVVGVLAAVYAGSVLALQGLLQGVTQDSSIAVAGSTIVVAAAFQPLRRRIQRRLDRRFDRRRYDARRAVEAFGSQLRDELDLRTVAAELSAAVATTVAPRSVALWVPAELPSLRDGPVQGR